VDGGGGGAQEGRAAAVQPLVLHDHADRGAVHQGRGAGSALLCKGPPREHDAPRPEAAETSICVTTRVAASIRKSGMPPKQGSAFQQEHSAFA